MFAFQLDEINKILSRKAIPDVAFVIRIPDDLLDLYTSTDNLIRIETDDDEYLVLHTGIQSTFDLYLPQKSNWNSSVSAYNYSKKTVGFATRIRVQRVDKLSGYIATPHPLITGSSFRMINSPSIYSVDYHADICATFDINLPHETYALAPEQYHIDVAQEIEQRKGKPLLQLSLPSMDPYSLIIAKP
ncbi:hypothetical protein HDU82_006765 [Entophlyctis luteolus]|nr:hypothetical protein HDU82_006765 [Entophlyctis luteolus]